MASSARERISGARASMASMARGTSGTSIGWICADHVQRIDVAGEPATPTDHLRRVRCSCNDTGFFDHHGYYVIMSIHADVQCHAVGERVGPEDVFHELVRGVRIDSAPVQRALNLLWIRACSVANQCTTFIDADLVEAGEPGVAGHVGSSPP